MDPTGFPGVKPSPTFLQGKLHRRQFDLRIDFSLKADPSGKCLLSSPLKRRCNKKIDLKPLAMVRQKKEDTSSPLHSTPSPTFLPPPDKRLRFHSLTLLLRVFMHLLTKLSQHFIFQSTLNHNKWEKCQRQVKTIIYIEFRVIIIYVSDLKKYKTRFNISSFSKQKSFTVLSFESSQLFNSFRDIDDRFPFAA